MVQRRRGVHQISIKRRRESCFKNMIILTRYELARLLGLRTLQIEEGASPLVPVQEGDYPMKIAAREIEGRVLDAVVCREGELHSIQTAKMPRDLDVIMRSL